MLELDIICEVGHKNRGLCPVQFCLKTAVSVTVLTTTLNALIRSVDVFITIGHG